MQAHESQERVPSTLLQPHVCRSRWKTTQAGSEQTETHEEVSEIIIAFSNWPKCIFLPASIHFSPLFPSFLSVSIPPLGSWWFGALWLSPSQYQRFGVFLDIKRWMQMLPVGSCSVGLWRAFLFSTVFKQIYIPSMGKVCFEQKYVQGCKGVFCIEVLLCSPVTPRTGTSRGQNVPAARAIQSPGPYRGTIKESAFWIRQRGFKRGNVQSHLSLIVNYIIRNFSLFKNQQVRFTVSSSSCYSEQNQSIPYFCIWYAAAITNHMWILLSLPNFLSVQGAIDLSFTLKEKQNKNKTPHHFLNRNRIKKVLSCLWIKMWLTCPVLGVSGIPWNCWKQDAYLRKRPEK